jgi:F-type H+/Na+-transporting ATPase subunit beta
MLARMTAANSDFWVYEDMTVHTATVHHGDCRWCNHGAGQWGRRNERESTWRGPYSSESAARSAPIRANSMFRDCGSCMV